MSDTRVSIQVYTSPSELVRLEDKIYSIELEVQKSLTRELGDVPVSLFVHSSANAGAARAAAEGTVEP